MFNNPIFWAYLRLLRRLINTLLHQKVATGNAICHLSDVPSDAEWNLKNTLVNSKGRAITIVTFGTLSSINLSIARDQPTSLSVIIDFLCEKDVQSLQRVYKLAQVDIGMLQVSPSVSHRSCQPRSCQGEPDSGLSLLRSPFQDHEGL